MTLCMLWIMQGLPDQGRLSYLFSAELRSRAFVSTQMQINKQLYTTTHKTTQDIMHIIAQKFNASPKKCSFITSKIWNISATDSILWPFNCPEQSTGIGDHQFDVLYVWLQAGASKIKWGQPETSNNILWWESWPWDHPVV